MPVGLCGELSSTNRVAGVTAARSASTSRRKSGARRVTGRRTPPGHLDHRDVGVVVGLEHDDLVARVDQAQQRGGDRLGAPGGHDHLAVRVELEAVVPLLVPGDRLPELGTPGPGAYWLCAVLQRPHRLRDHLRRPVPVGEPLAEVDRAGPHRQRRHLGEDRRARCPGAGWPAEERHAGHASVTAVTDQHISLPALAAEIDAACRLSGTFTLRSGQVSHEYFDKYLFETDPALLARVAGAMVALVPDDTELLGGLEMGGIPIATVLSSRTGLPALFVRKQAKEYGTCKLAEGPDVAGRRVTLVEDVDHHGRCGPGRHPRAARAGADVEVVVCAIDRSPEGENPLADVGLEVRPVLTKADLDARPRGWDARVRRRRLQAGLVLDGRRPWPRPGGCPLAVVRRCFHHS